MHQSGHERAQSMQTVQFSSRRAMTPRARVGGASFSFGYCTVSAPSRIVRPSVLSVTPRPFIRPGTFGLFTSGIRTPPSAAFPGHAGRVSGSVGASSSLALTARTAGRSLALAEPSERHLEDCRYHDVGDREGDEDLPREALQLVLAEAGKAEADPHDEEAEDRHLGEQDQRAGEVHPIVDR